jgi:enoyl-CoA hydratase/carnithine racemase
VDAGASPITYLDSSLDARTHTLTLTLARSDNGKNQLNVPFVAAIEEALLAAKQQTDLKGLILRSTHDKVFSTGADVGGEMVGLDSAQAREFSRRGHDVFGLLTQLPCPTVACIGGFCLGGGCELALCCDFRIAAKNIRIGLPEVNLGLIPGWGGTQRLPRLIGQSRALKMILSGEPANAEQALAWGLVDEIVETPDDLPAAAAKLLARFGGKAACTLKLAKKAVYDGAGKTLLEGLEQESALFRAAWDTEERAEGIDAFLGKRRPSWQD